MNPGIKHRKPQLKLLNEVDVMEVRDANICKRESATTYLDTSAIVKENEFYCVVIKFKFGDFGTEPDIDR